VHVVLDTGANVGTASFGADALASTGANGSVAMPLGPGPVGQVVPSAGGTQAVTSGGHWVITTGHCVSLPATAHTVETAGHCDATAGHCVAVPPPPVLPGQIVGSGGHCVAVPLPGPHGHCVVITGHWVVTTGH
jgi:hypothetical protein